MKLIVLLVSINVTMVMGDSIAQTITLKAENISLVDAMRNIQKQSGHSYFLKGKELANIRVNADINNLKLFEAMSLLLKGKPADWVLEDGTIVVRPSLKINRIKENEENLLKQERSVSGKVTDEDGNPLLGVTVFVKDRPQIGTSTDGNGVYALLNLPENAILVYRYMGYLEQEIPVGNQSSINVSLEIDQAGLEEVVVVGFGEQKKESVVASISTVKGEQLRMPNRSLSNNLAGQLPGLIAVQRSGEPGYDNAEFWIRGVSSFAGGTNPLVLVDGVPRNMNDIEPDEIESFTLLKDAAATSVYGSEGANGVVLITSKRGRVQKTSIAYRGEVSRLTPTRVPRFANSFDFLSLYNERMVNDGDAPAFSESELQMYKSGEDPDLYPSTDWYSELMRDYTSNTRHILSFRGGGDRMRYFVSGAYFGETGLFKVHDKYNNNSNLNRYNLRSNVDIDVTTSTKLGIDLSGQYLQANRPRNSPDNILSNIYGRPPYLVPAVYSDGTISRAPGEAQTPYAELVESGYRKEWRSQIQSKIRIDQKLDFITQGLKGRALASYDANSIYFMTRSKTPETFYAIGRDNEGELIFEAVDNGTPFSNPTTSSSGNKHIYLETALDYSRSFNRHIIGGMFLYYQKENQRHNNALAFRKQAWIGRGTYNFDNRYVLEGNFSVTGSEQFAEGYRYGFFPAVGVSWNLTNEPYFPEEMKNVLSGIKLRTSIGKTGNDDTGAERFLYRSTFETSEVGYRLGISETGGVNSKGTGLMEGRFDAPYLSWEIEMKRNYGIDLSLFNGRIDLQADYFNNNRTDILLQRRLVSEVAGFNEAPWQNFGEVRNKGVDGSLSLRHRIGEVDFSLRGNFTFARNKILEYDEIPQLYPWMEITGTRLNALNGIIAERLFTEDDFIIHVDASGKKNYTLKEGIAYFERHPNPQPGDIKFKDQNGDGIVESSVDLVRDYTYPTVPEIMYGFGINVGFKGFYTNVFFQGAENVSLSLTRAPAGGGVSIFYTFNEGLTRSAVSQEVIESRWTEDNPSQNVFYPRITDAGKYNTHNPSYSWWHRNASYLRLKNLEFGYNFPKQINSKFKMNMARIYLTGQNVALWDKVKFVDPELGNRGAGAVYPISSIWTLGLEVSF